MKLNNVIISGNVTLVPGLAGASATPNSPSVPATPPSSSGTSTSGTTTGSTTSPVVVTPPVVTAPTPLANVLQLRFEGTNGSTSFADDADSLRQFTPSGTAAISTAQALTGSSSLYLDGASTLVVGTVAEAQTILGSGDFTIEGGVLLVAQGFYYTFSMLSNSGSPFNDSTGFAIGVNGNTFALQVASADGLIQNVSFGYSAPSSQWTIIAATRNGNVLYLYINGLIAGLTSMVAAFAPRTDRALIVGNVEGAGPFFAPTPDSGYVDDITISQSAKYGRVPYTPGSAVYAAAPASPTPMSAPAPMLLHFEGASGATSFTDSATPARAITTVWKAAISTDTSYAGTSSLKLDGTSYLYLGTNLDAGPSTGTGDFTIEIAYNLSSGTNYTELPLVSRQAAGKGEEFGLSLDTASITFDAIGSDGNRYTITYQFSSATGTWYTLAVCRQGGLLYLYHQGYIRGVIALPVALAVTTAPLCIGGVAGPDPHGAPPISGYVDEAAITLYAKYGATPYVPGAASVPPPAPAPSPSTSVTPVAFHFEGANGSYTFTDSATPSRFVVPIGTASISTDKAYSGNSSLKLDGFSYLSVGSSLDAGPSTGTGDFTVEVAFVLVNGSIYQTLPLFSRVGGNNTEFAISVRSAGISFTVIGADGTNYNTEFSTNVAFGNWYTVALCRQANKLFFYVNGLIRAAYDMAQAARTYNNAALVIGGLSGYSPFGGAPSASYIDDAQITLSAKYGAQPYTPGSNVPPPASAPAPTTTVTPLAMGFEGANGSTTFTDTATPSRFFVPVGTATISTDQAVSGSSSLKLDGSSFLVVGSAADAGPTLGTGDFTVEAAVFFSSTYQNSTQGIIGRWGSDHEFLLRFENQNNIVGYINDANGNSLSLQGPVPLTAGSWNRIAFGRNGSVLYLYFNGLVVAATSFTGVLHRNSSDSMCIGAQSNNYNIFQGGYIDEVAITLAAKFGAQAYPPGAASYPAPAVSPTPATSASALTMHFEGANGSTAFTDDATPSRPILPILNPVISTDQALAGSSSLKLDGLSYLYLGSDLDTGPSLGSGEFTLEAGIWCSTAPNDNWAIVSRWSSDSEFALFVNGSGNILFFVQDTTQNRVQVQTSFTISTGIWYQIAVCRSAGTLYLYVNGNVAASVAMPNTAHATSRSALAIGGNLGASSVSRFAGYIDEVAITLSAKYGAANYAPAVNFVQPAPATSPSASMMLHLDGTDGSTSFSDAVDAYRTFGTKGSACIGTAQSLFGGASLNLSNDASSYLLVPTSPDQNQIGAGDFTLELSVYFVQSPSGNGCLISRWDSNYNCQFNLLVRGNQSLYFALRDANVNQYGFSAQTNFQTGVWYQLALCRHGSDIMFFCNGAYLGGGTYNGAFITGGFVPLTIGAQADGGALVGEVFIDEVRISQSALYAKYGYVPATQAFADTPATTSVVYAAPPNAPASTPNTTLLMHFDGSDGSTSFVDSSTAAHPAVATGSGPVTISTAQSLFGGSSLSVNVNNSGGYLQVGTTSDASHLGTGDFTIEASFYVTTMFNDGTRTIISRWNGNNQFLLYMNGSQIVFQLQDTQGNQSTTSANFNFAAATWYSVAVVKSGTTLYLYVGGSVVASQAFVTQVRTDNSNCRLCVGGIDGAGYQFCPGYIDEVRISQTALYGSDGYILATQEFTG